MNDYQTLVQMLRQSDEAQVVQAAHALGELGDLRAVDSLIELLSTTSNSRARNAAAIGLRDLGDNRAVLPLMEQIKLPAAAGYRGTLIYALEALDARPFVTDLAKLMCTGNFEEMSMVLRVIRTFEDPLSTDDCQQALAILRHCLPQYEYSSWQHGLLLQATETLNELLYA